MLQDDMRKRASRLFSKKIPDHLTKNFREINQAGYDAIKSALNENFYASQPTGFLETEHGKLDLQSHLYDRIEKARNLIVPWLDQVRPLAGASILEIGCGTGSDTIAFAEQGAEVIGIDLDEKSIRVARARCGAYGLNADFYSVNATEVHKMFPDKHFNFIVFYASLEHMTHQERIIAMQNTWNMLGADSYWCIIETPNRLGYFDAHTSLLPFFHWLPDDLAFKYSRFSPRPTFRDRYRDENDETMMLDFLRRGRGLSFHEFEISMEKLERLDVVSCMSMFHRRRNVLKWLRWRTSLEYEYESFLSKLCPNIHRGFFQRNLDLIIRKNSA